MPLHNRPCEITTSMPSSPPRPIEVEDADVSAQGSENHDQELAGNASDSDSSSYSSGVEKDEFIVVKLEELRKEVQCPICLGIIRKTRTVMECLHRFCRECIDKSMRLGNNECPACRTHCASRRSLRDDPNYDALIAALYPDIDKYEEEELAFHEEEKALNKQIQDSFAQILRRQSEAIGRKRTLSKATSSTYSKRQGNYRNLRARKNNHVVEHNDSDEEEGANEHDHRKVTSSSSDDENSAELKPRKYIKQGGSRSSQTSSGANADVGGDDNESERKRDLVGTLAGHISCTYLFGWGRGGLRSSLRTGGPNCANRRLSRNNRLPKLVNYLQHLHENDDVLKLNLMICSLDEDKIPSLKRPYLSCSPTSSVGNLCQYVAEQTSVGASEIEILLVKDSHPIKYSSNAPKESVIDHKLELLTENQSLEEIHAQFNEQNLVLAYQLKGKGEGNHGA